MQKVLFFNPLSPVHDRSLDIFREFLPGWKLRGIYNLKFPWYRDEKKPNADEIFYFKNSHFQSHNREAFDNVKALILFSSQIRVPPCNLIQEATLRGIPTIAIEEVYQIMLEQGRINNYLLPVDHFFAASEYERGKFIEIGVANEIIKTTGCMFRYKKNTTINFHQKKELKERLNLMVDKKVVTLCHSYLAPDLETIDAREKLLSITSEGLSSEYEMLVKPHPAENDRNFVGFVKRFAPNARIVARDISIDEILGITDILINRGNSQTIIDALQRDIPVIVIPIGRKTIFHDCLDEIIIKDNMDFPRVLELINSRGISLYRDIFEKHLSITPEEAVRNVISSIIEIVEKQDVYKPQERLIELALFWAWMGYPAQGVKTLSLGKKLYSNKVVIEKIYKLISCRINKEELISLKEWGNRRYQEWLLQSLWIKTLFLTHRKLDSQDREWLADYPPSMERLIFSPYSVLLYWCYKNSNMHKEAEILLDKLCKESDSTKEINRFKLNKFPENNRYYFGIDYWRTRFDYNTNLFIKNLLWRIETLRR